MTALKTLQDRGQSIWLDSISWEILESGTLARYGANLSVTGLTSNPTIFEHAIAASDRYDAAIRRHLEPQYSVERLFFDFALDDVVVAEGWKNSRASATRRQGRGGWSSRIWATAQAWPPCATARASTPASASHPRRD